MAVLLSLQGCMAAGKTTAAQIVERRLPEIKVDYENPIPVWQEVMRRGLFVDEPWAFAERQRMFIQYEISRVNNAKKRGGVTLFDLGIEEIEFFTLFYPKSKGFDWDIENLLAPELAELRGLRPHGCLFLDAGRDVLFSRRKSDTVKSRGFFDHFIEYMAEYKIKWFTGFPNTDFLCVERLTIDEVSDRIIIWIKKYLGSDN
jgi:deoxyadenosine/deoxycytidine kinase